MSTTEQPKSRAASREITFELCAESIQACLAAQQGGADRIELCSSLIEGGVTPSHGLIRQVVQRSGLPVHVLLRPRAGDFVYSDEDFAIMQEDLAHIRGLGARGVVLGLLNPDGTIDVPRTELLVGYAGTLEVTFHRAFDQAPSLEAALEAVIAAGCGRLLTSGGSENVAVGSVTLARLIHQARGRIAIAAGGGLRVSNAAEIARLSGAAHFHGSMRRRAQTASLPSETPWLDCYPEVAVEDIAAVIQQLRPPL